MSVFYANNQPEWVAGPTVTPAKGATWDTCEGTMLCTGNMFAAPWSIGQAFPDVPNFVLDADPAVEPAANGGYLARLTGRGVRRKRIYSQVISFADSEVVANLEVGGVPYSNSNSAWPEVDLMMNSQGFRQIVVGATVLSGSVGQRVSAPMEGAFPPPPPQIFDFIGTPRLQWPFSYVLARRDAIPLVDGPYQQAGPWLVTCDYVWRWRLVPGASS